MSAARVVRGEAKFATAPGQPMVVWKDRAELPCGCAVLVGIRIDTQEPSLVFTNCEQDGHFDAMVRAREAYVVTLQNPREGVEAVEVAREVLSAAFNLEEHREQPL